MFDGRLNWTIVDTIYVKGNKAVTIEKIKATLDSKLNDSPVIG